MERLSQARVGDVTSRRRRVRRCVLLGQAVWVTGENLLDVLDGSGSDKRATGADSKITVTDKSVSGATGT